MIRRLGFTKAFSIILLATLTGLAVAHGAGGHTGEFSYPVQATENNRRQAFQWVLESEAFDHLSASTQQYFVEELKPEPQPEGDAIPPLALETATTTPGDRNVLANDPRLDGGVRVQNQTASASFGDTVVIVYNHFTTTRTHVSVSQDGGTTFREVVVPSLPNGVNLGESMVTVDSSGNFYVTTLAMLADSVAVLVAKSMDRGLTWTQVADATTTEVKPRSLHDRPWIATDTSGRFNSSIYVTWTKFDDLASRSTIMFARSNNGGQSFLPPIEITTDTKGFDVTGSRLATGPDGEIYICWFDVRTNSLRLTSSTNGGISFAPAVTAFSYQNRATPSFLNAHFKTNNFASIAVDNSQGATRGQVYLTFNARPTFNSVDRSDVYLLRSNDNGRTWSAPVRVNDDTTTTDQWMPAVAVTPAGKVAVSWYDRRNDPINNSLIDVYFASSADGGVTFRNNIRITDTNWPLVPTPTALRFGYHGEYNQISARGEVINVNWGDDRNGLDANIFFADVAVDAAPTGDFVLSGRTILEQLRAGNEGKLLFDSRPLGEFSDKIQLSAESNLPNAKFLFSPAEIMPGSAFQLNVSVPEQARPGNYTVTVTGRANGITRATTARLVVLRPTLASKAARGVTANTGDSSQPEVVIDGQNVTHMIWQDDSEGLAQIFYARASDGENFSAPMNISRSTDGAEKPTLTIDAQNRLHVVWQEASADKSFIIYTRSDDGGTSFISKRMVSTAVEFGSDAAISVEANGTINVVWTGKQLVAGNTTSVFFARSTDNGETFTTPVTVRSTTTQGFFDPAIVADDQGTLHIAFTLQVVTGKRFNNFNFSASVLYVRSIDQGRTFTEPINLTPANFSLAESPTLLIDKLGTIMLLFSGLDVRQPFASREIYLARSFDSGSTFSPLILISRGNGDSTNLSACIDPFGNVNVVWRDTQTANHEIFLSRLFAGEINFSVPFNISQDLGISENPSIAVNNRGDLSIAWEDESAGNNEIFFLRFTDEDLPLTFITSFSPLIAPLESMVSITGTNFKNILDVRIGPFSTRFERVTDNEIRILVPSSAVPGIITIFTESSVARSSEALLIEGKIGALQPRLEFGAIGTGQFLLKSTKIVNRSPAARTIRAVNFTSQSFSVANVKLPVTLAPGASLDLPIAFSPKSLGFQFTNAIVVTDDTTSPIILALSGVGRDKEPPTVAIATPRGGERYRVGQVVRITWTAKDNAALSTQELQFSNDGGKTFPIVIATGLAGQRDFDWQVPDKVTETARVRIIAIDSSGNRGESTSEKDFRIRPARRN